MGIFLQKMDASCPSIVLFYIVSFHQHRKSGKIVTHISRLIYSIFPLLVVKKKSAFFWYLYNTLWPYLLKFCVSFILLFLQGSETKLRWNIPANISTYVKLTIYLIKEVLLYYTILLHAKKMRWVLLLRLLKIHFLL